MCEGQILCHYYQVQNNVIIKKVKLHMQVKRNDIFVKVKLNVIIIKVKLSNDQGHIQ